MTLRPGLNRSWLASSTGSGFPRRPAEDAEALQPGLPFGLDECGLAVAGRVALDQLFCLRRFAGQERSQLLDRAHQR